MKLTDATVRALSLTDGQTEHYDDSIPGLYVRVGRRTKTFMLTIGTGAARQRNTLGRYNPPHFTLVMARERAKDLMAQYRLCPPAERYEAPTFEEAYRTFQRTHEVKNRLSTRNTHHRLVKAHWTPLYPRPIDKITTGEIVTILDRLLDTPAEANHAFATLRTIFNWAVRRRLIERSPIQGLDRPAIQEPRTRAFSSKELVLIWRVCEADIPALKTYMTILRLLMLTGQRRSQITNLQAEQIDRDKRLIHWTADQMKGRRPHTLPYGDLVASILETLPRTGILLPSATGVVQPHTGYKKLQLDKRVQIPDWTVHDLRRTWATISAEELGTDPHIIEAVLAHQSGTAVARTYNRAKYIEPMRKALIAFEDWLQALLSTKEHTNG